MRVEIFIAKFCLKGRWREIFPSSLVNFIHSLARLNSTSMEHLNSYQTLLHTLAFPGAMQNRSRCNRRAQCPLGRVSILMYMFLLALQAIQNFHFLLLQSHAERPNPVQDLLNANILYRPSLSLQYYPVQNANGYKSDKYALHFLFLSLLYLFR